MKEAPVDYNALIQTAVQDSNIPKIYVNGFIVSTALSDFTVVMQLNGQTIQVMNVSYTSLKSLQEAIKTSIDNFEKKTGVSLLTISQIKNALIDTQIEHKPIEILKPDVKRAIEVEQVEVIKPKKKN